MVPLLFKSFWSVRYLSCFRIQLCHTFFVFLLCLSFLIFRAQWVKVVVSSQSECTQNLDQNTLLRYYYYYYYKDLLRGSHVSGSMQHTFLHSEYSPSSNPFANPHFIDDKTEAHKGYRGLAYAYIIAALRTWI